jgi:hypothetical protein
MMPGVQPGGVLGKDQLRIGRHALTVAIMTEMAQECVISVITAPARRQLVIPQGWPSVHDPPAGGGAGPAPLTGEREHPAAAAYLACHLPFYRRLRAPPD